jgi:Recombinase
MEREPNDRITHLRRMLFSHNGRAESAGYRQDYKGRGKRVEAGPRAGRIYTIADVKVDPISFFNVLWRFRRWANYLDADTIIEGGDYVPHAVEFDSSFSEIVEAMALTIAQTLNAEGLRSPRARAGRHHSWSPSSVRTVLFNALYKGEVIWGRTKKRDAWGRRKESDRPPRSGRSPRSSTCAS